jgi:anti-sigma regulatory factor (Ser/Thr protein kinase)
MTDEWKALPIGSEVATEVRVVGRHWTCLACGARRAPQMAVAVFETFENAVTHAPDVRVKGFQCLKCGRSVR